MKTHVWAAWLLLGCAVSAEAVPPVLVAEHEGRSLRLALEALHVEVQIVGGVAETTATMTFRNPVPRALEGDFYFPLPEGATVSGYALDVQGAMVEGVSVERRKGREVFEQITRRKIDPGLAEWVEGSTFKTRVFPLPADGTRTVRVRYLSELAGGRRSPAYHLPLDYKHPLAEFSLRVEVLRRAAPPAIVRAPALRHLSFARVRDRYLAETRITDALLDRDLVVAFPEFEQPQVLVEEAEDGECYFAIQDFPEAPRPEPVRVPQRLTIFWDASRSRAAADHDRELALLGAYFHRLAPTEGKPVEVDLVLFRNVASPPKRLIVGRDPGPLLRELQAVEYDGGTSLRSIRPLSKSAPDLYLLFSDGIGTFGKEVAPQLDAPTFVIAADPAANHPLLEGLALANGGRYFNLGRLRDAEVLPEIGRAPYCFLSAASADGAVGEVYPRSPRAVDSRLILVGKLKNDEAEVTLSYGRRGAPSQRHAFHLRRLAAPRRPVSQAPVHDPARRRLLWATRGSAAAKGRARADDPFAEAVEAPAHDGWLRRLWGQKKLAELVIAPQRNEAEILALGRQFGMVTPYTSLIVLDSLSQYLEFRIPPRASSGNMREEYFARVGVLDRQERADQADRREEVIRMWEAHVREWAEEHKVSPYFKYTDKPKAPKSHAYRNRSYHRSYNHIPFGGSIGGFGSMGGSMGGMGAIGGGMGGGMGGSMGGGMGGMGGGIGGMGGGMNGGMSGMGGGMGAGMGGMGGGMAGMSGGMGRARSAPKAGADSSPAVDLPQPADTPRPAPQAEPAKPAAAGKTRARPPLAGSAPRILLQPWSTGAPYLAELREAEPEDLFAVYLNNASQYGNSPGFYVDCADLFWELNQPALAIQVLSNLAEIGPDDATLLRVMAQRLIRMGRWDLALETLEKVRKLRPEEPQSHRDLALALADRAQRRAQSAAEAGDSRGTPASSRADYARAIRLLAHVALTRWDDRFPEIELLALEEANRIIPKATAAGLTEIPLDPGLIENLDVDLRIVLAWDAENTEVGLQVTEPSGEKASTGHRHTTIGGMLSRELRAYGPERYMVRKAMKGTYKIEACEGATRSNTLFTPVTVQVDVFTNYGRPNESRQTMTLRLEGGGKCSPVGVVKFGPRSKPPPRHQQNDQPAGA
jgi:hypothetical protein